ncbi:hypothetical protein J6590_049162 [Homalodisca vitripennis]|nr:hypothetical protein J6590_049162 [Homalodisca vitripennis]
MSQALSGRSVAARNIAASPPIMARGECFPHPRGHANLYNDNRLKSQDRQTVTVTGAGRRYLLTPTTAKIPSPTLLAEPTSRPDANIQHQDRCSPETVGTLYEGVPKSNRNCIAGSRQRVVHIPAARRVSRNPLRAQ